MMGQRGVCALIELIRRCIVLISLKAIAQTLQALLPNFYSQYSLRAGYYELPKLHYNRTK